MKEGTTIQMQPLAFKDKIKLNFRVEFSRILGVETARLPTATNHSGDSALTRVPAATTTPAETTVQIPEVERSRIEGSIDLPLKSSILLRGLERIDEKQGPIMLLVMLRAEKFPAAK